MKKLNFRSDLAPSDLLKWITTITESVFIVLTIVFTIDFGITIFSNNYNQFTTISQDVSFIGLICTLFISILFPYILKFTIFISDYQIVKIYEMRMNKKVLTTLNKQRTLNLQKYSKDIKVPEYELRKFLIMKYEQGIIKGKFNRISDNSEEFCLDFDFNILTAQEQKEQYFQKYIKQYLRSYKSIEIAKIGKSFDLNSQIIEELLRKEIEKENLKGHFENNVYCNDNFADSVNLIKVNTKEEFLEECNYCHKKTLQNAPYCSYCGKKITFDDEELKYI